MKAGYWSFCAACRAPFVIPIDVRDEIVEHRRVAKDDFEREGLLCPPCLAQIPKNVGMNR